MVFEYTLEKVFDELLKSVKKILQDKDYRTNIKKSDLQTSLFDHNNLIMTWMNTINFKELRSPKTLDNVYIDLDIQLTPKKWLPENFSHKYFCIDDIIKRNYHLIILGDVGAGKTTTLKHICSKFFNVKNSQFTNNSFPILIRLRNIEQGESLMGYIKNLFGIEIFYTGKRNDETEDIIKQKREEKHLLNRIIINYLEQLEVLILIDGFDEIPSEKQSQILHEINEIVVQTKKCKVVLTCRSAVYEFNLPNSEVFEICPLNQKKIEKFTYNWLDKNKIETESFLNQLNRSPFSDTAIRPLTLSLLCALYTKYKIIPNQPKSIYKRVVNLLIEDWDLQRGIIRGSSFANFEIDKKLDFLYCIAYQLTITTSGQKSFSEETLLSIFDKIHSNFSISKSERLNVIREIESDTGLIIKVSHNNFEFAHASIQEYLCAEYIVRLPKVIEFDILTKNLMDELAITVALSSNPTYYFATLIFDYFPKIDHNRIPSFLRRIILENPEFNAEPLFAISVIQIYTNFFTEWDGKQRQSKSEIEPFTDFWTSIEKNANFKKSLSRIEDFYFIQKRENNLIILNKTGSIYTGFNYPNFLVIKEQFYTIN